MYALQREQLSETASEARPENQGICMSVCNMRMRYGPETSYK